MAKRAKNVPAVDVDALVTVFVTLASFDSSESEPVSVQEMADELDAPHSENAFTLLETLADAELIEFERGKVWISREDVTETNAEDIAVNALNGFTPVAPVEPKKLTAKEQDYKERTAYNAAVAASQEPGSQHLHPMADARIEVTDKADGSYIETNTLDYSDLMEENDSTPVLPAVTPVQATDGTNVTVPVDPENDPKGPRRELDADKGERVISEDTYTLKACADAVVTFLGVDDNKTVSDALEGIRKDAPKTAEALGELLEKLESLKPARLPEIDGLEQFIDDETGDMVYESRIVQAGLALDEPSEIPERPNGVHPNTWDLAHTAITQTARDYWLAKALEDAKAHEASAAA